METSSLVLPAFEALVEKIKTAETGGEAMTYAQAALNLANAAARMKDA